MIFVDENKTFNVKIWYKKEINPDTGEELFEVSITPKEEWNCVICECIHPSAEKLSNILEQATIVNAVDKRPILQTKRFRDLTWICFIKKMTVIENNEEKKYDVNSEIIEKLNWNISNAIFIKYLIQTGIMKSLESSILE